MDHLHTLQYYVTNINHIIYTLTIISRQILQPSVFNARFSKSIISSFFFSFPNNLLTRELVITGSTHKRQLYLIFESETYLKHVLLFQDWIKEKLTLRK